MGGGAGHGWSHADDRDAKGGGHDPGGDPGSYHGGDPGHFHDPHAHDAGHGFGHDDMGHHDPFGDDKKGGGHDWADWGANDHDTGMHLDEWHHKLDNDGRLLDDDKQLVLLEGHHILFDHNGMACDETGHPFLVDGFEVTIDAKNHVIT